MDHLVLPPDEGEPNAAECFVHNYLVFVLVVLLHARFSVVGPIPFLLAAIFFRVIPIIIGSTTVLPDNGFEALLTSYSGGEALIFIIYINTHTRACMKLLYIRMHARAQNLSSCQLTNKVLHVHVIYFCHVYCCSLYV